MITRRINEFIAEADRPIVLIVQPPVRRSLANFLKQRASRCLVLSINELPATQAVEVVGVIGAEEPAPAAIEQPLEGALAA